MKPFQVIFLMPLFLQVGLVESLLTLNIVDELTETVAMEIEKHLHKELLTLLRDFSNGSDKVMIGQSLINISNGARARLSGIVAALMLLVFVMFGSNLIGQVPMAV